MDEFVSVSEAKSKLTELVRNAEDHNVVVMRHGKPAGVLLSVDRYEGLLEQLDDLEDRLAVYENDGDVAVPWEKLKVEMGLAESS